MTIHLRSPLDAGPASSVDVAVPSRTTVRVNDWGAAGGDLRPVAYALTTTVAIATAVSLIGPNVDLALTRLFIDPVAVRFPAASNATIASFRDHGMVSMIVWLGCIGLVVAKLMPWNLPGLTARAAAWLTTAYLLGPGLLVNGILKVLWGRPRPIEVIEFGGTLQFVNWWDTGGACPSNCSFVSGEAAAAAWLFGPAMLVPAAWRPIAVTLAAAFFIFTSALRVTAGAHFVTDVLIAGLSSVLVLLVSRRLFYPQASVLRNAIV
jgi:membrane-associated phospholipid phosphatase